MDVWKRKAQRLHDNTNRNATKSRPMFVFVFVLLKFKVLLLEASPGFIKGRIRSNKPLEQIVYY